MLITIFSCIIGIAALILLIIGLSKEFFDVENITLIFLVTIVVVFCVSGFAEIMASADNIITHDVKHEVAVQEREAIVYRLGKQDSEESYTVNGGVYMDAVEFNKKVKTDKKWGKNPWTNWLNGWVYADLDEIEIYSVIKGVNK